MDAFLETARFPGHALVVTPNEPDEDRGFACVKGLRDRGVAGEAIHVSLERNMKCAVGHCGHCQLGPHFLCRNGPVFAYPEVERFLMTREF